LHSASQEALTYVRETHCTAPVRKAAQDGLKPSGRLFSPQVVTISIIAASFEKVSVIGVLRNLVAVPLSGPILTLGLLEALAGNLVVPLAYLLNTCNGSLVILLAWVAEAVSALPIAAV
jgi:predicted membrane metal-binding protein